MNSSKVSTQQAQFKKYQQNWESNAKLDALWAVLTLDGKIGQGWDEDAFFKIGDDEITEVLRIIKKKSISLEKQDRAFDFGCGVGRISQALGKHFSEVVGIDISTSMLEKAKEFNKRLPQANIRYIHSTSSDLSRDLEPGNKGFDFVYSNITLQHLNNDLQCEYIRQFSKITKTGGLVVFQIPSLPPIKSTVVKRTLKMFYSIKPKQALSLLATVIKHKIRPWQIKMEMNVLTAEKVKSVATAAQLELLATAYVDWQSFYMDQSFILLENSPGASTLFPESTFYFFRKT